MSHRVLSPQQFFHGTDVDIEGEEIRPPTLRSGRLGRVFTATTAEGAARYGKHVYQVEPRKGARGVFDPHGTYMYGREGHSGIEAHSFKSPMRIVQKVQRASYSSTTDSERLENLRWLKEQGHEVSPEGEQFLKEHG